MDETTTTTVRSTRARRAATGRRRVTAAAGAGLLALALAACNPLSVTPTTNSLFSEAQYRYSGPSNVWFEVAVTGTAGYQVETRTVVWVPQTPPNTEQRVCGSATVRGERVNCDMSYAEFPHTRENRDHTGALGTFWPTIVVRAGENVRVHVLCSQGGARIDCPASTKVEGRTVDDTGKLVGDLTNPNAG